MEIKINNGSSMIDVNFGDIPFTDESAVSAVERLFRLVSGDMTPVNITSMQPETVKPQADKNDFNIRNRLPNNVVDISKMDIKQAVTENALVRCPNCGQGHCLIIDSNIGSILMRKDYDKNEFEIICEGRNFECPPGKEKEYFEDLQNMSPMQSRNLAVNNNTDIRCPICGKTYKFIDWKKAYEEPLSYFEYDKPCDVCGGEMSIKITKGHESCVCGKCGWEAAGIV